MMLDFKLQKPYNEFLIKAHDKYHLPLIISQDCHYCRQEHSKNQRLMLMQQNKRTLADIQAMIDAGQAEDLFELQDSNLWLKSEDEMNVMWESKYKDNIPYELYKEAKANTVKICEIAKGVEIDRTLKLPMLANCNEELWEEIKKGFIARRCPRTPQYSKRIREEYDLICEKGFASYFLIQKMMTDEARRLGPQILGFGDGSESVGPGRGSQCGSLVAYCLRLHDIEPIIHDLRFSRFLSPARGGQQMKIRHSLEPQPHSQIQL
jgi:DNA polymerase-3 subunit alpha